MNVVSVNVGLPREVDWRGRRVRTSIWKTPVPGRVRVHRLNLEGDEQSDPSAHGGPDKAVYAYPSEHYEYWRRELPGMDLAWGAFGENLTTEGLLEDRVKIGDRLRVGSAEFRVTQPRMPCYKLGVRFGRHDMVKRFLASGRTGFYLAVLSEGELAGGDPVALTARDDHDVTVADIAALYTHDAGNQDLLRRAVDVPALPESWRDYLRQRLDLRPSPSRPGRGEGERPRRHRAVRPSHHQGPAAEHAQPSASSTSCCSIAPGMERRRSDRMP
jgi:MOSC domain-containing protein YiiM